MNKVLNINIIKVIKNFKVLNLILLPKIIFQMINNISNKIGRIIIKTNKKIHKMKKLLVVEVLAIFLILIMIK
jgi:hypothetical protein